MIVPLFLAQVTFFGYFGNDIIVLIIKNHEYGTVLVTSYLSVTNIFVVAKMSINTILGGL